MVTDMRRYSAAGCGALVLWCAVAVAAEAPAVNTPSAPSFLSSNGCFRVQTTLEQSLTLNTFFYSDWTVEALCGQPADALRFYFDMPAHNHGTVYRPRIDQKSPDRYQIAGHYLHMPGAWRWQLEIDHGTHTEVIEHEVVVLP